MNNQNTSQQQNLSNKDATFKVLFWGLVATTVSLIIIPQLLVFSIPLLHNEGVNLVLVILLLLPVMLGYLLSLSMIAGIPILLYWFRPARKYVVICLAMLLIALGNLGHYVIGSIIAEKDAPTLSAQDAVALVRQCKVTKVSEDTPYDKKASDNLGSLVLSDGDNETHRYFHKNDMRIIASNAYDVRPKCGQLDVEYESYATTAVTKSQAIELLQSCRILAAYYSDDSMSYQHEPYGNHGIVYGYANDPIVMYISKEEAPEMLPIIKNVQQTCATLHLFRNQT